MALTATEEALVRQLLDQQAAILSLAGNESTITSKLGATKVTLSDLVAASAVDNADLFLLRQGTTDKSVTGAIVKALATQPNASETVKGIVELATAAETVTGTDATRAVHPEGLTAALATVGASVESLFKKLTCSAPGNSANISVTADEVVVQNPSNQYKTLRNVALTVAGTAVGANGLDAGTIAASTWYSLWIIWNGTTTAGLMSLSATAPTLPSGYTHKARVGWIRTDNTSNKYPLGFKQYGRSVKYTIGAANVPGMPLMASGANVGTPISGVWVAVSVSAFVPSTASRIQGAADATSTSMYVFVAPNNTYGGYGSATNPPPVGALGLSSVAGITPFDFILESTNIYWNNANGTCYLWATGWEDNL